MAEEALYLAMLHLRMMSVLDERTVWRASESGARTARSSVSRVFLIEKRARRLVRC